MITVIYNRDYPLNVIKVLLNISVERTWVIANDMNRKKSLGDYDVLKFDGIEDAMNFFITESIHYEKHLGLLKQR